MPPLEIPAAKKSTKRASPGTPGPTMPSSQAWPAVIAIGALLAGVGIWSAVQRSAPSPAFDLATVARVDLPDAVATMAGSPAELRDVAAQANSCKAPLARVTIAGNGTIQIVSGAYTSPPFELTNTPQAVAIPFPAPYQTGHGNLSVIGNATSATISITPAWGVHGLPGGQAQSISVHWTPSRTCE